MLAHKAHHKATSIHTHNSKPKPKRRNQRSKPLTVLHTRQHSIRPNTRSHPQSALTRTFSSTYSDFSELDDDLFDSGPSPDPTGPLIMTRNLDGVSQQQQQTQQQRPSSTKNALPMTIYNVISGVNPTPVGVTVFRLSGPHSYHILSLLTRTPLSKIKTLATKRIFTSTLYSIPDELGDMRLLRDTNAVVRGDGNHHHNTPHTVDEFSRQIDSPPSVWDLPDESFALVAPSPENSIQTSPRPIVNTHQHDNHHGPNHAKTTSGLIPLPNNDDIIDLEAMILSFRGPKSFTGEDTIELHVHGNPIIVRQLFSNLGKLTCSQVAKNGEFIQRAYLNNRLSLLQVEAYYDLIHSTNATEIVHASKTSKMNKDIMFVYSRWRHVLIESLAYLESIIDFGEDEGDIDHSEILKYIYPQVIAIRDDIQQLLQRKTREKVVNGINVSILGEPNVGKSSLLNKVIGRQLAIVSAIPGTTRDVVSTSIEIDGLPVQIHDTAGIRDTTDLVEWEGIRRATALSQDVDYRVVLFDTTALVHQITNILDDEYKGDFSQIGDCGTEQPNINKKQQLIPVEFSPDHAKQLLNPQFQLTPLDNKISTLISSTLTTQHPSIKRLLTPQTLLVWTKSDLLPFTSFTHLQTMSSQPTTDPIYLQKQTKTRDEFEAQERSKVVDEIHSLRQIMNNQTSFDRSQLIQPNGTPVVDRDELFNDLAAQISDKRTLSLNNTANHSEANNHTASNVKLLNSIPLDLYLTNLTKRTISGQSQAFLSDTTSIVDDVLCVSSRYNYRIAEISTAIHNFAHQTVSSTMKLASSQSLPNDRNTNDLTDLALTSLFAKHDITLSARHRQSLLLCFDSLNAFVHQMATVCSPAVRETISAHINTSQRQDTQQAVILPKAPRSTLPSRDLDLVLSAASLRNAVNNIAEIDGQGEVHAEEVLDAVFNRFCIGK